MNVLTVKLTEIAMKTVLLFVFAAVALFVSCEDSTQGSEPDRTRVPTDPEELIVWNSVYDDEYKFPEGFYSEPQVNGTSIHYLGDNSPDWDFYKLRHTDSFEQAREWWHSMMEDNPDEPVLLGENKTDKHFEFVSITKYGHITRWRFHKSSYFMAAGNVFFHALRPEWYEPYTMGIFGGELEESAVKELVELLWFFEPAGEILSTEFNESPENFTYNITSAVLSPGDWGMYDWIHVIKNTVVLDKETRELRSTDCVLLQAIQGIYRPGIS